jgi:hypothetical protein
MKTCTLVSSPGNQIWKFLRYLSVLVIALVDLPARHAFAGDLLSDPRWVWVGATTDDSVRIQTAWDPGRTPGPLLLWLEGCDAGEVTRHGPTRIHPFGGFGQLVTWEIRGLQAQTGWRFAWHEEDPTAKSGSFRTFPPAGQPADFSFAFASCADTGSGHPVFDAIREQNPLFFLHTGDLHYEDIAVNRVERFREAYEQVFASPVQNRFFRSQPVIYMWDDHDYGPNNADSTSPSREAALASYRETVPHFPLALGEDPDAAVAQAFTVGRVRFLLTDLRSARDPNQAPDVPGKSMFGGTQLAWFREQLLAARDDHALIVWLSSMPWIADDRSDDRWSSYTHERRVISDFIVNHGIRNLVMISGDSHMLAADDGRHNRYAQDGEGPGFPVWHAAALDRSGSVKGGPYSEGSYPGGGQFGMVHIEDQGDLIHVRFEGRNHRGRVLVRHAFTRRVMNPAAGIVPQP